MIGHEPVLDLRAALPQFEASVLPNAPLDLRLMPGECALIQTQDVERMTAFSDLCSGMIGLRSGSVHCMGFDWTELGAEPAAALRGRIGRLHQHAAWTSLLPTHVNIMLPQLHHTRTRPAEIAREALTLARRMGLPGLPLGRPERLSEEDRIRASCVRAFLGEPRLLLLEGATSTDQAELFEPFLGLLSSALGRGAAAVCFTREARLWREQGFTSPRSLVLLDRGLVAMARA